MNAIVASIDSVNRRATTRSERLAARSSMSWTRGSCGRQPRVGERIAAFVQRRRPLPAR